MGWVFAFQPTQWVGLWVRVGCERPIPNIFAKALSYKAGLGARQWR
jgi:hypothetical protein